MAAVRTHHFVSMVGTHHLRTRKGILVIDAYRLAQLPRDKPLTTTSTTRGRTCVFTCAICGAWQEPHSWRVQLPHSAGTACPGCAADAGFTIK